MLLLPGPDSANTMCNKMTDAELYKFLEKVEEWTPLAIREAIFNQVDQSTKSKIAGDLFLTFELEALLSMFFQLKRVILQNKWPNNIVKFERIHFVQALNMACDNWETRTVDQWPDWMHGQRERIKKFQNS